MGFSEDFKALAGRLVPLKNVLQTEESVKYSLVMPFLQLLGYNIFDPNELVPEYLINDDAGRVSYAIFHKGEPHILIEVAGPGVKLADDEEKLNRCFNIFKKAKFAMLTNGTLYSIFSDINEEKIMDKEPFLTVDLEKAEDEVITEVEKFKKENYNIESILSRHIDTKYEEKVNVYLEKQLKEPDEDFIRFVLGKIYPKELTDEIVKRFEPIIKKVIAEF